MNGTTRSCVINSPLITPHTPPAATAPNADSAGSKVREQNCGDDGAQGDDRPDRQVDAAGHDHHRHAERRDADDHGLTRNQFQVGGAKELWPDQRTEQRQDERQSDEHPGVVETAAARLRCACAGRVHQQRVFVPFRHVTRRTKPAASHYRDAIAHPSSSGK